MRSTTQAQVLSAFWMSTGTASSVTAASCLVPELSGLIIGLTLIHTCECKRALCHEIKPAFAHQIGSCGHHCCAGKIFCHARQATDT